MYLQQWKESNNPNKEVVIKYLEEIKEKVHYNHPLCEEARVALIYNDTFGTWFPVIGLRYWHPFLMESTEVTWIPNSEEKTELEFVNRHTVDELVTKFEAAYKRMN